jgi:hypothetical protein
MIAHLLLWLLGYSPVFIVDAIRVRNASCGAAAE